MLRQEVYALDGTNKERHPCAVTEQNLAIRRLQPRAGNRHAVFLTHPRETINYHYERNPADPRIAHALTLEVDEFGNVLKSAAVGYGRRQSIRVEDAQGGINEIPNPELNKLDLSDRPQQTQPLITYTENNFTKAMDAADDYRTPMPCETRTYELTGYAPSGGAGRFQSPDFVKPNPKDHNGIKLIHDFDREIAYEDKPTNGRQRRLIEQLRTLYRPDDLGAARNDPLALLPFETVEPLALPGETYKLAFTPGLLTQVYQRPHDGRPPENLLPDPASVLLARGAGGQAADRGGYVDLDGDGHWWIPSGRTFYSPRSDDTAEQELAYARQHFFLPQRYRDPFGQTATMTYDAHDLLVVETRDPLGNRVTVGERDRAGNLTAPGNDYRVLQPRQVMDPNRNRTAVVFDALGMVAGTAVMGKPEENLGDSLAGFEADLTEAVVLDYLANPLADPHAVLGKATTRLVYDLFAYRRTRNGLDPLRVW